MNFRQLEVFRAIMQTGSVTEAARMLNVSQPTVSVILKHAESQIGLRMFQRIGNRLHPTPEAVELFPTIESIFARVDSLDQSLKKLKDGQSGILQAAATPSLTTAILLPSLKVFAREYPLVHVVIRGSPTVETVSAVARHRAEIGLTYSSGKGELVETEPFFETEISCVLRSDHPLAERDVVEASDLADYPVIANVSGTPLRRKIDAVLQAAGTAIEPRVEVGTLDAYELCRLGVGVGVLDRLPFSPEKFPNLVCRPFAPRITAEAHLLYPAHRPRSLVVQRFVDVLRLSIAQKKDVAHVAS